MATRAAGWSFRSADPTTWGKNVNKGPTNFAQGSNESARQYSVPEAYQDGKASYVIIPVTKAIFTKSANDASTAGTAAITNYNGFHLGIYDVTKQEKKGDVNTYSPGAFGGKPGWGFGNRAYVVYRHGYGWAGNKIVKYGFRNRSHGRAIDGRL